MSDQSQVYAGLLVAQPLAHAHGFSWTIASRLGAALDRAQMLFGQRDMSFTPLGVEFSETGPYIWFPGDANNVVVSLSLPAMTDPFIAIFEMAHEAVHLLSPARVDQITWLEECVATWFSVYFSRISDYPCPASRITGLYAEALLDAEVLFSSGLGVIKPLRPGGSSFALITKADLLTTATHLDPAFAEKMVTRCGRLRPIPLGPP